MDHVAPAIRDARAEDLAAIVDLYRRAQDDGKARDAGASDEANLAKYEDVFFALLDFDQRGR